MEEADKRTGKRNSERVNGNVFSTYPVVHALRKKHVPVLTIIENDEEKLIVRIPSGS